MRGIISAWVAARSRRGNAPGEHVPAPDAPDDTSAAIARRLGRSIDRALSLGLAAHAGRLVRSARRLAPRHPRLAERLARFHLAAGRPDLALRVVDCCRSRTTSLRFLRIICLMQLGSKPAAHLQLHRWSGKATAPLDARMLLALLSCESGDLAAAIDPLLKNLHQIEDPFALALLLLISVERGKTGQAQGWARRLRRLGAWTDLGPTIQLLLQSLGFEGCSATIEACEEQARALAAELIAFEEVIPALVEAQHVHLEPAMARLIGRAVEIALPDLALPEPALEALATLAHLQLDHDAARAWARRGLKLNPMSATFARLADAAPATPRAPAPAASHPAPQQEKAA